VAFPFGLFALKAALLTGLAFNLLLTTVSGLR
jgi:hypothetical protein